MNEINLKNTAFCACRHSARMIKVKNIFRTVSSPLREIFGGFFYGVCMTKQLARRIALCMVLLLSLIHI